MIVEPSIKIRILREMKGLTQENVASELKLSTKAYQKIEVGKTQLTIFRLNQIALILEMDPIEILNFDEGSVFSKKENKTSVGNNQPLLKLILAAKDEQILSLNKQISFLKDQISFFKKIYVEKK